MWRSTPMGHPGCWSVGKGCRFGSQGRLRCERYDAPLDDAELEGGQEGAHQGGHRHCGRRARSTAAASTGPCSPAPRL